jgi:2-amino-4-hydroxy-6-hydroxymethyldihydropteridine diphosphokinase
VSANVHLPIKVFVALGSNEGDRVAALRSAVDRLQGCLLVEHLSLVYETEPGYVQDQPRYLNMVVQGSTRLDPHPLLLCLKQIERDLGRAGGVRWGPRPIDLDILLYGDRQVDLPDLQIPHVRLGERPFVLLPLAELAPDLVPPGLGASVHELAAQAPAIGEVIARLGALPDLPGEQ